MYFFFERNHGSDAHCPALARRKKLDLDQFKMNNLLILKTRAAPTWQTDGRRYTIIHPVKDGRIKIDFIYLPNYHFVLINIQQTH